MGADLSLLSALPRFPEGQGGSQVLVLRQPALAEPVQALRHGDGRIRGQVPGPVQHAPLSGAARQWHRLPHPQRLRLHEPGCGRAREDRRPRSPFHAARGLLFPELELADRELAQEGVGDDRGAGGPEIRGIAGDGAARVHHRRRRPRQHLRADGELRQGDPAALQDLAISLRISEPGLCRLSRLLRLPEGAVSDDTGSGHRQDGPGRRFRTCSVPTTN